MDLQLFQDMSRAERLDMLDAQADEITEESYLRPYESEELQKKRELYVKLSLEMAQIKAEEEDMRAEFKEKKAPIQKALDSVLGNIKQGGEYVTGKLYKIVDAEERVTGFYNEDGKLMSQRKSLPNELQPNLFREMRGNINMVPFKTGTDEK